MSNVQTPKVYASEGQDALHAKPVLAPRATNFGLDVGDLRKSFISPSGDKLEVLRGVSFSAHLGETVAITGCSGAGKSTLLHLLAGIEEPDHGSIRAGSLSLENASHAALAHFRNQSIGLVFQFHHLLKDFTALENVSLPLMIRRNSFREARAVAGAMLASAGLSDRSSHLVGDLSGGEQQRVAVCRALVSRPAMVLADEPTGNLDSATGDAIAASLISYAKTTPALLILVTHSQSLAAICDRSMSLSDGRLYET